MPTMRRLWYDDLPFALTRCVKLLQCFAWSDDILMLINLFDIIRRYNNVFNTKLKGYLHEDNTPTKFRVLNVARAVGAVQGTFCSCKQPVPYQFHKPLDYYNKYMHAVHLFCKIRKNAGVDLTYKTFKYMVRCAACPLCSIPSCCRGEVHCVYPTITARTINMHQYIMIYKYKSIILKNII